MLQSSHCNARLELMQWSIFLDFDVKSNHLTFFVNRCDGYGGRVRVPFPCVGFLYCLQSSTDSSSIELRVWL